MFDAMIIGGGAAGLATAVMLKQRAPQLQVALFEQLDRVGKKISVTGNGRCNITNRIIAEKHYHGKRTSLAMDILSRFPLQATTDFFSAIGVEIVYENDKAYPRSFQASSVVDALRFAAGNLGVHTFSAVTVLDIAKKGDTFHIKTDNTGFPPAMLTAKTVVIATGGLAGGKKLGSTGDGYRFLSKFGHRILPQSPVIVQVKTENHITKSLKGIKVNAAVTITGPSGKIAADSGEVLFCDYGLSGPPVFQLSRYCQAGTEIQLDLFSDMDHKSLAELLLRRKTIFKGCPLTEFFAGLLHKRLGQAVLKTCGIPLSKQPEDLTAHDCKAVASTLKAFSFKVTGNTGFINAQATSGGADLADFSETLMSKKCPALFAAGEVLDVDGDCGGYNLQWAWSSANAITNGIINHLSER